MPISIQIVWKSPSVSPPETEINAIRSLKLQVIPNAQLCPEVSNELIRIILFSRQREPSQRIGKIIEVLVWHIKQPARFLVSYQRTIFRNFSSILRIESSLIFSIDTHQWRKEHGITKGRKTANIVDIHTGIVDAGISQINTHLTRLEPVTHLALVEDNIGIVTSYCHTLVVGTSIISTYHTFTLIVTQREIVIKLL